MKAAAPRWLKMAEVVPITSWPRLARPSAPCDAGGATPGIQGGITLAVTQSGISTRLRFAGPSPVRPMDALAGGMADRRGDAGDQGGGAFGQRPDPHHFLRPLGRRQLVEIGGELGGDVG